MKVNQFKLTAVSSAIAGIALIGPMNAVAMGEDDVLPEAKAGECYAKVLVPPVYKTESITAVSSEASEKLVIIPAKYKTTSERVLVKEASTRLAAVPPVYDTVDKRIQVSASTKDWVRGSLKSRVGASEGMLSDLAGSGVKLDDVSPGTCFYEHYKPAIYKTSQEKVMISEATETLNVEPAKYATSDKQVLVKAASKRLVEVPAVFKTVDDKILIEPAKKVWKKGSGPIMKIDHTTGEIMCLVDVPAVYETFPKRIVAAPPLTTTVVVPSEFETLKVETLAVDAKEVRIPVEAKYEMVAKREKAAEGEFSWVSGRPGNASALGKHTGNVVCLTETPAEYKVVKQRVVKTPGTFTKVEVPAVYKNVEIRKLISDATVVKNAIPEKKKTFVKRLKVSDARLEWRPVLCETNTGPETVTQIQKALADKGYNPGVIDGVIGKGTLEALTRFQKAKNLAQGGITYDTLEALGVNL